MNERKLLKYLANKGITSVWHFTDQKNIKSIKKYGLSSLSHIRKKDIHVKRYGADDMSHSLDRKKGLDKYVHLSFIKDHPMYHVALRRKTIKNPVWIEVDISVLFKSSTRFSNKVANSTNASIFKIKKIRKKINFDTMIHSDNFDKKKEARKAEILVYKKISPDKIYL